ncbi:fimbrial protein [Burkholderia sp. SCN-KJ]|uniref:fimbrial protein n=1 Tax=Burkholderia sp. SCN-KJ TaxID=2969248 RepID=UPI0021503BB8|nr:fimbrial protein [Burkholderia sp. SCN-KJ]MCR4469090.1 type 1 fimbrial protein [Burkholderia sp. SCN-KJ]
MAKYLLLAALCLTSSLYSVAGHAQTPTCYNDESADYQRRFGFGNVLVPQNAPNGAVLATTVLTMPYRCDANPYPPGGYSFYFHDAQRPSNIPGVTYLLSWPSMGLRFTNMETGQVMHSSLSSRAEWAPPNTSTQPISGFYRIKVELVKLSDLIYNGVKLPQSSVGQWNIGAENRAYPTAGGYRYQFYWNDRGGSLTIMPNTCTVTTPNIPVPLQPIAASKLNAVGMTAGDKGFDIGLSCKSGSNVYVTLTDLTDPGNTGDQLTLTPDSTAKGVKLRILRNGQPVGYGPDSAAIGNTNQWYVGPSATTTSIPLSAQYIATGQVSGGTVKGVATFTMSYQ